MPITEAQKRAIDKWNKSTIRYTLYMKPNEYDTIKSSAEKEGLTIMRYLVKAHEEYQKSLFPNNQQQ